MDFMDIIEIQISSSEYPLLLKQIHDPPKSLFVRGSVSLLQHPHTLAVVGTRKCTAYGLSSTEKLASLAAEHDIVIISGLARGIDGTAHKAALKVHGKTIAVLGGGVDDSSIYPPEHKNLANEIINSGGAVISEYPPKSNIYKGNFVARNRIIIGLAKAVLVTEAPEKSGALITANLAADYNRELLCVPGMISNPAAVGTNKLIRDSGARVVLEIQDILEAFSILPKGAAKWKRNSNFSNEQNILLKILSENPLTISELAEKSQMEIPLITSSLTTLELMEKIVSHMDGRYSVK